MTPEEAQRIVRRMACYEFPFDTTRALELALFRTFGAPRVAGLLDRTGEFQRVAQKRYDDTDLLISEFVENGFDSDRGRAAIERMNAIHGRFRIDNDDFLYVLSTFVFEPIRWNARFGWRRWTATERDAWFCFWREIGRRMQLRDLPASYEQFERFNTEYEAIHFHYSDAGHRVAIATREMFAAWFVRPLRPLVRQAIYALVEEPVRRAVGFPAPSRVANWLVPMALRARGWLAGRWPTRRRPRLRTALARPSYPRGYTIPTLGPTYLQHHDRHPPDRQ